MGNTSSTDICNLALLHLGKQPIADINEASETARRCKLVYNHTRDTVLRDYPWGFALKTVSLALLADATVLGWDYVYAYPADAANVWKVYSEDTYGYVAPDNFDKRNYNDQVVIVSNLENAIAEYSCVVTNASLYDAQFVDAFAALLAMKLASPLTGKDAETQKMFGVYQAALAKASASNANERQIDPQSLRTFANPRSGISNSRWTRR